MCVDSKGDNLKTNNGQYRVNKREYQNCMKQVGFNPKGTTSIISLTDIWNSPPISQYTFKR